jgi:lambda repressor-like predicted transcriptional regulator
MKSKNFSVDQVKADIQAVVSMPGMSINRLSQDAGVEWKVLKRFLSGDGAGISASTLEKLWPYVYGDKRPTPATGTASTSRSPQAPTQTCG